MTEGERARFERYVARLSEDEVLVLHRIVSRRAAAIYEPLHRARQKYGYDDWRARTAAQ